MKSMKRMGLAALMILILMGIGGGMSVHAATTYTGVTITATCSGYTATGTIEEPTNNVTVVTVIASDSAGNPVMSGTGSLSVALPPGQPVAFPSGTFNYPYPVDGPITVQVLGFPGASFQSTNSVSGCRGGGFVLMGNGAAPVVPSCVNTDGRLNSACDAPMESVAVYCAADGGIMVWGIDNGQGFYDFTASAKEIAAAGVNPKKHVLIKEKHDRQLWRLSTGQFEINGPTADGKGYTFVFAGCGMTF